MPQERMVKRLVLIARALLHLSRIASGISAAIAVLAIILSLMGKLAPAFYQVMLTSTLVLSVISLIISFITGDFEP